MADNDLQIVLPDSDEVLTCSKCKTANPLESNFCLNCGTRLQTPSGSNLKWSWLIILVFCCVSVIYYFYFRVNEFKPRQSAPADIEPAVPPKAAPTIAPEPRDIPEAVSEKEISPVDDETISLDVSSNVKIPVGKVLIKDINGKIINEIAVPVVAGGWVALPKQACLGGG